MQKKRELKIELKLNSILAFGLLVISVLLRIAFLDLIEFKSDEFIAIKLAQENIHQNGIVLKGLKSSTGLYNPPFFIYLISLPVFFTSDPIWVTFFVILLNLLGLALLYFLAKMLFQRNLALIITALFSSAPWAILYSRKIWAQDCLFFFLAAFYLTLFSNIKKYSRAKVYLLFVLLSFTTQLHMSAWFLPFPLLVFFVFFKIKIKPIDLVFGIWAIYFFLLSLYLFSYNDSFFKYQYNFV